MKRIMLLLTITALVVAMLAVGAGPVSAAANTSNCKYDTNTTTCSGGFGGPFVDEGVVGGSGGGYHIVADDISDTQTGSQGFGEGGRNADLSDNPGGGYGGGYGAHCEDWNEYPEGCVGGEGGFLKDLAP